MKELEAEAAADRVERNRVLEEKVSTGINVWWRRLSSWDHVCWLRGRAFLTDDERITRYAVEGWNPHGDFGARWHSPHVSTPLWIRDSDARHLSFDLRSNIHLGHTRINQG